MPNFRLMSSDRAPAGTPAGAPGLRSRWNRAFAVLLTVVVVSGMAGLIGTRLLVETSRDSAVQLEREATIAAKLRADVVAHAVVFASPTTPTQQRQVGAVQSAVQTGFARAIANAHTAAATRLLRDSQAQWQTIVAAAGPPGHRATLATRGAAVSTQVPTVLTLLDRAGSTSRAAARADLARAASLGRWVIAVLAVLELAAIGLAVRLARRLSTEVLQPVGILRDSANKLAAGELDHRVVLDRADELGELAASFKPWLRPSPAATAA